MRIFSLRLLTLIFAASCSLVSYSQLKSETNILKRAAVLRAETRKAERQKLLALAKEKGWDTLIRGKKGYVASLARVDAFGMPLYIATENVNSAATIGTSKLWTGGSTGLNLDGAANNVKGKLALWDGGSPLGTHIEFAGRINEKDNADISDHSTHVAGTMIAKGINPVAKGMAHGIQELLAYDMLNNSDIEEMMAEAPNLLVSNHSYGFPAGWQFNNRWEFYGPPNSTEDYKFGYYSEEAQLWDSIVYNAPYYLPVKSAGNNRELNGPPVGEPYFRRNASGAWVEGDRPAGISNNDAYDILSTVSNAKNILVVGSTNPVSVYSSAKDVALTSFSSWGPTDDGRIKPDLVTDGVNVLSPISTANNAYDIYTGTSMSSPAAAGSLLLLQEYYSRLHGGTFMRASTLKGITIHTAREAGPNPGPDYQFGWGLLNMEGAAAVITANNTTHLIQENVLSNGGTFSLPVIASGNGTLRATICWTDPKGAVTPEGSALDNTSKKLVNDLDLVIKKGTTIYRTWTLNPSVPANAATRSSNANDNVEKVELPDVVPGETYTIEITHKNTLARGSQAYSLIVSGVSSQPYCASGASTNAGAKIDSVSFNKIRKKNVSGCTTYNNYTNLTDTIETNQALPLFVRLRSCDATSADKIVKAFIDFNNDGDFTDAGENVATSPVISGDGDFASNITLPAGLATGNYSVLRIVMQETNSAAAITPCGSYTRGETQDYKVYVAAPSTDVGVIELMSPANGECPSTGQYVAVRIRNFGRVNKTNIPVSVEVRKGAIVVSNLSATFTGIVPAGEDAIYTFQAPLAFDANSTYTFTSTTSLGGDQKPTNDESVATVGISGNSAAPAGTAVVCNNNVLLKVSPATTDLYTWYDTNTATTPIATGTSTSTTTMAATYYLAKNDVSKKLGPANKLVFPAGGYLQFDASGGEQARLIFDATQPVLLDKARMYIGHAGKIKLLLRRITDFNYEDGSYSYYPSLDSTYTIDVYPTAPTPPIPNEANNDPADQGAIFHLGMIAPTEGTWAIFATTTGGASVFRNRDITTTNYPYTIPGVIELTGNGAIETGVPNPDPNYNQGFYYFFYNMSIQIAGCASARTAIVPTTPTPPVITLNGTQLSSSAAAGNQWHRNGTAIAGAVGQTYTPILSGTYTVRTTTNGCTLTSNEIPYVATALPNVDPSEIGLTVTPNPAPLGQFQMQLETRTRANLDISLINTMGQKVYHQSKTGFIGRLTQSVNPGKLAPGIYYLQVVHDKKRYIRKVVVLE